MTVDGFSEEEDTRASPRPLSTLNFDAPEEDPPRPNSPILKDAHKDKKVKKVMYRNGIIDGIQKIYRIPLEDTAQVSVLKAESPSVIWVRILNHISDQLVVMEPSPYGQTLKPLEAQYFRPQCYAMAPEEPMPATDEWDKPRRRYGRARILRIEKLNGHEVAEVLFIDRGVRAWMGRDVLATLPDDFYYHPWQAMLVSLSGVRPVFRDSVRQLRWRQEDCDLLRSIVNEYSVFKITAVRQTLAHMDFGTAKIVEMEGLDSALAEVSDGAARKKEKTGVCIGTMFALRSGRMVNIERVFNADTHITYDSPSHKEVVSIPPQHQVFPVDWQTETVEDWKRKLRENDYKEGEEKGWKYHPAEEQFQIPHIDLDYLNDENRLFVRDGAVTFSILGSQTVSPYEFYGMPFETVDPKTSKQLRCSEAMGKVHAERKSQKIILDAYYADKENLFALEQADVIQWITEGLRVYAIADCFNSSKRKKQGLYQRIEILGIDSTAMHYRVRFLDSGGIIPFSVHSVFKISAAHCQWPSLAVQLCWMGVKDSEVDHAREKTFSATTIDVFKENFYDDGPVRLALAGMCPLNKNRIYNPKHAPEPYEMWNTLFVIKIDISASLVSWSPDLLTTLKFEGKPVPGRLIVDENEPVPMWDDEE